MTPVQPAFCKDTSAELFCHGIFVAEVSLSIVIAKVLWAFDISSVPGTTPLDLGHKLVIKPNFLLEPSYNPSRHNRFTHFPVYVSVVLIFLLAAGLITEPKLHRVSIVPRSEKVRQAILEAEKITRIDILDFESVKNTRGAKQCGGCVWAW